VTMRTVFRNKLPQSLSYPIGLELIRSALAGAPQLDALRVMFSSGHWQATKFRQSLRNREPYVLVTASHVPASKPGFIGSNDMAERGHYDESWELTVNPTPRELRAVARRLLIAEGLPAIASWLQKTAKEAGDSRHRRVDFVFDADRESLSALEYVGA
jgi:hypothetical protein